MNKLIIFDLDGVLVEAKEIHFKSLNIALSHLNEKLVISWEEHIKIFDGLKTFDKLALLSELRNYQFSSSEKQNIFDLKQKITQNFLNTLLPNKDLINIFLKLRLHGFKIACCSNSIRQTVNLVLEKLNLINYFDLILSNEDVRFAKPYPEIYWKAMAHFGVSQQDTLIVEDSPTGLTAAHKSGANVLRVKSTADFTFETLSNSLNYNKIDVIKWVDKGVNVLIPMAGLGSRFSKAGFTFPKPLIEVHGKPMIQIVVDNLGLDANYIFIVQKTHRQQYNLDSMLPLIAPKCKIIEVDGITEGAACTALLAKDLINSENPLIIANSDQFLEWNHLEFYYKMNEQKSDGCILTFNSTHPKWSYVKLNANGNITEVAEKKPISDIATTGIYYWRKGSDFCKFAELMIENQDRVNNEFYICPVYNYAIKNGLKINTFDVKKMWGLGTPEDLEYFERNFKEMY